jgi:hypothetical protein
MDLTYVLLCGALWVQLEKREAGRELIRALADVDDEIRMIARGMLELAGDRSKELIGEAIAEEQLPQDQIGLFAFTPLKSPMTGWSTRMRVPMDAA